MNYGSAGEIRKLMKIAISYGEDADGTTVCSFSELEKGKKLVHKRGGEEQKHWERQYKIQSFSIKFIRSSLSAREHLLKLKSSEGKVIEAEELNAKF